MPDSVKLRMMAEVPRCPRCGGSPACVPAREQAVDAAFDTDQDWSTGGDVILAANAASDVWEPIVRALVEHKEHDDACAVNWTGLPCDCGRDAAFVRAVEALGA